MFSCLFIAALWSPAGGGGGLISWLSCMWCFVTFPCGVQGQVWCLVVSILDLSALLLSFMLSLSDNNHANVIAAFNPT